MRNAKTILFLLLAVVTLLAVEFFLSMSGRKPRVAARAFLLEEAIAMTSLTFERRGEAPVRLAKDGTWRLVRPFAAPVEVPVVLKLLDTLARSPVEESISDAELLRLGRTRADFALEDPPLRVCLSNETTCAALSFGLPTPSADGVYVSIDGEQTVLIVPLSVLAAIDLPVDRIRRRRLFGFGENAVTAFDVKQSPGSLLSFTRAGDVWRVGAGKASSAVVSKFLSGLTTAEAQGFVWPTGATNESEQASASRLAGYGLDPETSVTVTLKRSGGRNASISFGKPADEKTVYAFVHTSGMVVTVPAAFRDAALQDVARFADTRLFPETPEKIAVLTLSDGRSTLSLSRTDQAAWQLDAPIAAPADASAVEALLARVLALTPADLDPNGMAVSLGAAAKPVSVSAAALFPSGEGFAPLRAREIVDFKPDEVKRLVATPGTEGARGVSVVFARDRRVWNVESAPEGAVVSNAGVTRVLKALAPLRALRVVKLKVAASELAAYGLERPVLRLSVDLDRDDAVRRNILLGAATEDGGRYATVGSADAVFVISADTADALRTPLTVGGI